jgi:O-antigen/teichoic acid export membrane protein
MVVAFVLTPFLIRALGQHVYGLVVLLGVFTAQGFGSLADFGLASAVVKYTAEYAARHDEARLQSLFGSSFWLYVMIGFGSGLLVWVGGSFALAHLFNLAPADLPLARVLLAVLACTTVVDFVGLWLAAVLDGLQRFTVANAVQIGRTILYAGLVTASVQAGYGAVGWVVATGAANVAACIVLYWFVRRSTAWSPWSSSVDRHMVRTMWSFSLKVFVVRITGVLYNSIDRTALGIFRPAESLAVYDVANKIHRIAFLPMGLTTALAVPSTSSLAAANRVDDLRELFLRGTLYTVALCLPLVVILLMLAPFILAAWVGDGFVRYTPETRLFLSYLLFWPLPQIGWNMMIGLNRTKKLLPVNIVSVGMNLVLSLLLASSYGVLGVIVGTVIGNLVATPWYLAVFTREIGVTVKEFGRRVVLRSYPQGLVLAAGLWAVLQIHTPHSLGMLALFVVGAYLFYAVLFWFTGVDMVDRARFRSALRWPVVSGDAPR